MPATTSSTRKLRRPAQLTIYGTFSSGNNLGRHQNTSNSLTVEVIPYKTMKRSLAPSINTSTVPLGPFPPRHYPLKLRNNYGKTSLSKMSPMLSRLPATTLLTLLPPPLKTFSPLHTVLECPQYVNFG